ETSAPGPAVMRVGVGVPAKSSRGSGISYITGALTTDTWLTTKADGRVSERLAREWSWDATGTTLQLKLRKDVRLHDGALLTPGIAAAALREAVAAPMSAASFARVRSIQPSGDDTVTLTLSEPNSFLLADLAQVSLTLQRGKQIDSTGPFEVVRQD